MKMDGRRGANIVSERRRNHDTAVDCGNINSEKVDGRRRVTVNLSCAHAEILEEARPQDGSLSDAFRALIAVAVKADLIEHQNRELTSALTMAMAEMSASMAEIRRQVARLERDRS